MSPRKGEGQRPQSRGFSTLPLDAETVRLLDRELSLLSDIADLTVSLNEAARRGDFEALNDLFVQKEGKMTETLRLREQIAALPGERVHQEDITRIFAPIARKIEEGDSQLLAILRDRKQGIIERSKEAQLQRFVMQYTH